MAGVARINLDAQFWVDVGEVAARVGDYDKAVAQAVRLIKFGQERYQKKKPITHEEFLAKFSAGDALMPEFARKEGDFVQVAGAENHFQWLSKKSEAGAKGGRSKTEAKTKHLKQNRNKKSEATTEAPPKQTEASSSTSTSSSVSTSTSVSIISNSSNSTNAAIAAYCERFKARWGVNPQIQGKDAGIAGRLAKGMSADRFGYLLDAYFSMPDAGVVKAKHPLNLFELKMNEVCVFADSGQFTTNRQAHQADDMASNHLLLQKIREGKR